MSTDLTSDWNAFRQFVSSQLDGSLQGKSLEESLEEFRAYQKDVEALRAKINRSLEQSEKGESSELNEEEFWKRVGLRLDGLGITE